MCCKVDQYGIPLVPQPVTIYLPRSHVQRTINTACCPDQDRYDSTMAELVVLFELPFKNSSGTEKQSVRRREYSYRLSRTALQPCRG